MPRPSPIRAIRPHWPALVLAIAGLFCLANAGSAWWRYGSFQAQNANLFNRVQAAGSLPGSGAAKRPHSGEPIGRISIPRLHLSTTIVEGVDEDALGLGVGHMPESASLGGSGNIVLAGHRDTAFWPLRNVRKGDRVQITADKKFTYVVKSLTVVKPSDVSLLRPTSESILTVVTCYPFRHIGPAPKRMIIRAALVRARL